jgi:DNA-directed RNA polymerase specialized sigma24 family protein
MKLLIKRVTVSWLTKKCAPRGLIAWFESQAISEVHSVINVLTNDGHSQWANWLVEAAKRKRKPEPYSRYKAKYDQERSGEASPYWDNHRSGTDEAVAANPDRLEESITPWPKREATSEALTRRIEAVKRAYKEATEAQCRVFDLVGSRGMTFRDAATVLDIDVSSVRDHIVAFRRRAEKIYKETTPQEG